MLPFYLGAGILGFLFLSSRRAQAAITIPDGPAPPPSQHYGLDEPQISTPIPAGWRRMKQSEVTPELLAFASSQIAGVAQMPYGTTATHGNVMALVEQHYHEPGGAAKPWGYHHGITLLTKA